MTGATGHQHRPSVVVVAPVAGAAGLIAVLIATMLMLSAVLGGAAAQAGCEDPATMTGAAPGAPRDLQPIFAAAARRYRLGNRGPSILAGLTEVESGFGKNMGPSSAGAIGWTQFMPATWRTYGVDANHDGRRDPYTAEDAIFASARYLAAGGAPNDWHRALFSYNHSDAYVQAVLDHARRLAGGTIPLRAPTPQPGIFVVGDSLEVGTFSLLQQRFGTGISGDFASGRPSSAGVEVLRRALATGQYGAIVFDLGTNDGDAAQLRRSLREVARLAADRPLYVATVNSPFDQEAKNTLLRRFADAHADVTLIDWQRASRGLALADGIHGAYRERANVFAAALANAPAPVASCAAATDGQVGAVRTVGGPARLMAIPGQPGQLVDERILPDVVYLIDRYHLAITAAYSLDPVHASGGEHPLGLALDIVPGPRGSWDDVDRLARWAEPTQNAPRPPFRWVGYDGDPNHGRGNHLHLSWNHSPAPSRRPPAATVDVFATTTAVR